MCVALEVGTYIILIGLCNAPSWEKLVAVLVRSCSTEACSCSRPDLATEMASLVVFLSHPGRLLAFLLVFVLLIVLGILKGNVVEQRGHTTLLCFIIVELQSAECHLNIRKNRTTARPILGSI